MTPEQWAEAKRQGDMRLDLMEEDVRKMRALLKRPRGELTREDLDKLSRFALRFKGRVGGYGAFLLSLLAEQEYEKISGQRPK